MDEEFKEALLSAALATPLESADQAKLKGVSLTPHLSEPAHVLPPNNCPHLPETVSPQEFVALRSLGTL